MNNQYIVGFLSNCLSINLKGRRFTPLSYFQALVDSDNYHYLTDPIDIIAWDSPLMGMSFYGYGFKAGFSVVASMVVGYQGSDTQKIIDIVLLRFQIPKNHLFTAVRATLAPLQQCDSTRYHCPTLGYRRNKEDSSAISARTKRGESAKD